MIKYVLTILGLLAITYGVREWKHSRFVGLLLIVISLVGTLLVWLPHQADRIAQAMGVMRGADMILYCYSAISFVMILNLGLKQRELQQSITQLARYIAVMSPRQPEDEGQGTP